MGAAANHMARMRLFAAGTMMAALLLAAAPARAQEDSRRYAEAEVQRVAATARTAYAAGRYRDAIIMLRDVHAFATAELGPDHPLTLQALTNVAALLLVQGDKDGALPLALAAAGGLERVSGPDNVETLNALANLAQLHVARGERAAAEPLLRRVYAGRQRTLGITHAATLEALLELAAFLNRDGRVRELRAELAQGLAAARESQGAESAIATDLAAAAAAAEGNPVPVEG